MPNTYTPVRNGFAQSTYPDQQATALAGMLAFASDKNLVDSFIVGEVGDDGLEAGLAVVAGPAPDIQRPGLNEQAVTLPGATAVSADIIGIVVRAQQMRSNTAGHACHWAGDLCNVVRAGRAGGRIWVRLAEGAQPALGGAVFVHAGAAQAGTFTTAAGDGIIAVISMKFMSAAVDGLALVELQ